ncbi:MAG TPA: acetate--CoA ligase family protein [Myxococcota bacterium]|nr:acetate--CoA ligase family protein [Myxococcota bacterium]
MSARLDSKPETRLDAAPGAASGAALDAAPGATSDAHPSARPDAKRLDTLFDPKSIAIVGASDRASSWSREIYSNLRELGFPGAIFPINARRATVWGEPAYPSLRDTPQPVELAIIAIPAAAAVEAVRACGAARIPSAMVVSSGFRDAGAAGAELQRELAAAAREGGVALLGPNVEGFINYPGRVAAYGAEMPPTSRAGSISMFSQSGTAAWTFIHMAGDRGVGVRVATGVGVEATLGIADLLEWAARDPETAVAACYVETIRDLRALARGIEAMQRADKRVVVCCPRIAGEAAKASVVAHTGELLGDTTLRDATLRRLGAVVVHDPIALFETALLLEHARAGCRGKLAVAMQSGGNCTLFADALGAAKVPVEPFRAATLHALSEILPAFSEPRNPLDVTGQAVFDSEIYCRALDVLAADPEVGMIAIDVAPSRKRPDDSDLTRILAHAAQVERASAKPVISVLATPLAYVGRTAEPILAHRVAVLQGHAPAATAIAGLYEVSRERLPLAERHGEPPRISIEPGVLDEVAAAAIFARYGIERPREAVVGSPEQAAEQAAELGGAVVVKLVCAEVPHKAREGLVKLNLGSRAEVESAAREVQARARTLGVDASRLLVQEQLAAGPEFLLGATVDPSYGPAIALRRGGGGVSGDTAFHLVPLLAGEAQQITERAVDASGWQLSDAQRKALADVVERFAWLAQDLSDRILEIEANPILISGGRAVAVDALAVAKPNTGEHACPSKR